MAPRGAYTYDLTSRTQAHASAVRREYAELFDKDGNLNAAARSPVLFSVFLDSSKIETGSEVAFSIDLAGAGRWCGRHRAVRIVGVRDSDGVREGLQGQPGDFVVGVEVKLPARAPLSRPSGTLSRDGRGED